jgi:hypothetical protein
MPFHEEEADATTGKEEAPDDAPVEASIVDEKQGHTRTREV